MHLYWLKHAVTQFVDTYDLYHDRIERPLMQNVLYIRTAAKHLLEASERLIPREILPLGHPLSNFLEMVRKGTRMLSRINKFENNGEGGLKDWDWDMYKIGVQAVSLHARAVQDLLECRGRLFLGKGQSLKETGWVMNEVEMKVWRELMEMTVKEKKSSGWGDWTDWGIFGKKEKDGKRKGLFGGLKSGWFKKGIGEENIVTNVDVVEEESEAEIERALDSPTTATSGLSSFLGHIGMKSKRSHDSLKRASTDTKESSQNQGIMTTKPHLKRKPNDPTPPVKKGKERKEDSEWDVKRAKKRVSFLIPIVSEDGSVGNEPQNVEDQEDPEVLAALAAAGFHDMAKDATPRASSSVLHCGFTEPTAAANVKFTQTPKPVAKNRISLLSEGLKNYRPHLFRQKSRESMINSYTSEMEDDPFASDSSEASTLPTVPTFPKTTIPVASARTPPPITSILKTPSIRAPTVRASTSKTPSLSLDSFMPASGTKHATVGSIPIPNKPDKKSGSTPRSRLSSDISFSGTPRLSINDDIFGFSEGANQETLPKRPTFESPTPKTVLKEVKQMAHLMSKPVAPATTMINAAIHPGQGGRAGGPLAEGILKSVAEMNHWSMVTAKREDVARSAGMMKTDVLDLDAAALRKELDDREEGWAGAW